MNRSDLKNLLIKGGHRMKTKKFISKLTASALACAMILSLGSTMPVHAQTIDEELPVFRKF